MYQPLQVLAITSTQAGGAKSVNIGPRYGQGAVPWKYSIQAEVTLTPEQWLQQDYGGSWVRTTWRSPTIAAKQRNVFDVLLPDDALPKIEADFPDMIVIGEWDSNTGAKRRAIHARAIDVMPDNVERDKDGNEISRTRSATLRDHHVWAGMAPRDWG